ncbi:MAG: polysaccharide lyase [Pseudonocardia sp.]
MGRGGPVTGRATAPQHPVHRLTRRPGAVLLGVLLVIAAGCAAAAPEAGPGPRASINDEISIADLEEFFGGGLEFWDHGSFGVDRAELIETAGGAMVRVFYPAGSASRRAEGEDGGMQVYMRLPDDPVDELYLQYYVRFPPDFDFVKGGKLPGLYGGTVTGGQNIPDGTDGFSTRYMWRRGGDGEVYAYLPTSEKHGTSLGRGCWYFTPGRWTAIQQRVRLNTPGEADGEMTVWQDGWQVLTQTGLTFRTTDDLKIDGLFFSTFFGGGDTSWASPDDQYADFAAFAVSDGYIPLAAGDGPADEDAPEGDEACGVAGTR